MSTCCCWLVEQQICRNWDRCVLLRRRNERTDRCRLTERGSGKVHVVNVPKRKRCGSPRHPSILCASSYATPNLVEPYVVVYINASTSPPQRVQAIPTRHPDPTTFSRPLHPDAKVKGFIVAVIENVPILVNNWNCSCDTIIPPTARPARGRLRTRMANW